MTVSIDSVLVQELEPKAAALDGGTVLMSLRAGSYFSFNAVASEIWDLCAQPRPVAEIFAALMESREVDAETLAREVTPFLQTLVDERLLRVVAEGEAP